MSLYTRSGDDGSTGLFGGERVGKDHPRVEAYGTVDELNAWIGLAVAACGKTPLQEKFRAVLTEVQSRLFDLGADLAAPAESPHRDKIAPTTSDHVREVERWIDEIDAGNEPIKRFVLPGGTELSGRLHVARAVCRRAERRVVVVTRITTISPHAVEFINRLSDLLFAMARRANTEAGVADVPWRPGGKKEPG